MISSVFMQLSQNLSRVDAQAAIVNACLSDSSKILSSLGNSILVEGLFLSELAFDGPMEAMYQQSAGVIDGYSQSYEATQVEYNKVNLQVRAMQQTIHLLKADFRFQMEQAYNQQYSTVISNEKIHQQHR